ncbi:hypothetical protein [Thauera chlorobenzoica]|uniref:Uncharacterized protein n=1 Tax=Thauera chlorobenzoica TaxID=96773 RepID=A0A1H5Z2P3_9RHOO|nr:hypothetical protein [Thauera chlorobenzoica]APR05841.1 hypothetical protein Tchl_3026 [Thauera chlorobenzoica]SEG30773.1 hypothetical protein SAMN05216242_1402 [Thauera chlorobenzoica]
MSDALIREIAEKIIQEQLLQNWHFYALLLGLLLINSAAAGWVGSYFRKRGETYATKADMDAILDQIHATTEVAEQVKTAIAHSDWTTREWKTLRRVKLEELMEAVYATREWLSKELNSRLFGQTQSSGASPVWKVQLVSRLYFPEMAREIQALALFYWTYTHWLTQVQQKVLAAQSDIAAHAAVLDEAMDTIKTHEEQLVALVADIEAKAPAVMKEIVGL